MMLCAVVQPVAIQSCQLFSENNADQRTITFAFETLWVNTSNRLLRGLGSRGVVAIALFALFQQQAFAECENNYDCANEPHWKITLGTHLAARDISMYYERKNDPTRTIKEIGDVPQEADFRAFGLASVEYAFNERSAVEFEYSNNSVEDTGVIRRTTRFFGLPLRLALRVPVKLTTENFKLRYAYSMLRTEDWRLAGTAGVRDFRAGVTYVHSDFTQQTDAYQIYLPTFGALLAYRWNDRLALSARADYLPIRSKYNHGSVGDFDLAAEYQIPDGILVGLGYRYTQILLNSNREEWQGNLSYVTHGPTAYLGVRF